MERPLKTITLKNDNGEDITYTLSGEYPELTAGSAEQIISDEYTENKVPYLLRASGGNGSKREEDTLVGGTVAWNQLADPNTSGWWASTGITLSISDNVFTITSTSSSSQAKQARLITPVVNHIYLLSAYAKCDGSATVARLGMFASSGTFKGGVEGTGASYEYGAYIGKLTDANDYIALRTGNATASGSGASFDRPMVIDLTQMFGSTIADYIYSLEQANAGAGVAWFKKLFPASYYAYNAGELMSVSGVEAHKMVGFNAWDEEWENGYYRRDTGAKAGDSDTTYIRSKNFIPCLPDTQYYFKAPATHASNSTYYAALFYDADKNFITAHNNLAQYPTKTSPSNAGYVTFYVEVGTSGATYKDDICLNLSSSRNGEYEPYKEISYPLDDSLTLRGIPKLDGSNNLYYDGDTYEADGTVTRKYQQRAYQSGDEALADAITDGTNTVVKLATPTTEEADPYQNPQTVDPDGTEEYVTTSIVPVGHETKYYADLVERLAAIPEPPTANGTYRLIATVSGGVATLSWVAN